MRPNKKIASLAPLLLLLLLVVVADAVVSQPGAYCCLPVKWHSHMLKTNVKLQRYLGRDGFTGRSDSEASEPIRLQVFVNHRRPRFEIRADTGRSQVYWRGHMWLFVRNDTSPVHMNAVKNGYKPSGGYAPFYFRCLAPANGFARLNDTHYRLVEPDTSPVGVRFDLKTTTDVYVVPAPDKGPAVIKGQPRHTCLLSSFSVTSTYLRAVPRRGPAMVFDIGTYTSESPPRRGWPDKQLTEQTRAYRKYYYGLLRSGAIQVNQPHRSVPVLTDGGVGNTADTDAAQF